MSTVVEGGDARVFLLPGIRRAERFIALHATATVEDIANLGDGCVVWAMAYVMRGAKIGTKCMLGQGVHVSSAAVIGNGCSLQNGAQVFSGVELSDDVFLGPHVVFTNVLTPRAFLGRKHEFKLTKVGRGASIGANATIVCGVTIGEYAMVGAGAVVTKNVAPHVLVVGNPAEKIGFVCRCGVRLRIPCETPGAAWLDRAPEPYEGPCSDCRARLRVTYNERYPFPVSVQALDAP